jgi:hypothetical protein
MVSELKGVGLSAAFLIVLASPVEAWRIGKAQETEVKRLSPRDFKVLPSKAIKELEALGCSVPQSAASDEDSTPHNVISGSFAQKGQTDWAVLCSTNGASSIVVLWGGPAKCEFRLPSGSDKAFLGSGNSIYGLSYLRRIESVTSKKHISLRLKMDRKVKLPLIDHAAISDEYNDELIHYCSRGKWWTGNQSSPYE